jgi:MoxR-like ATPase
MQAAQALAALRNRDYVLPDDIKELFVPVIAHRMVIETKERLKGATPQKILREVLNQTEVPTQELNE